MAKYINDTSTRHTRERNWERERERHSFFCSRRKLQFALARAQCTRPKFVKTVVCNFPSKERERESERLCGAREKNAIYKNLLGIMRTVGWHQYIGDRSRSARLECAIIIINGRDPHSFRFLLSFFGSCSLVALGWSSLSHDICSTAATAAAAAAAIART